MNLELHIARRLLKRSERNSYARPVVNIAVASIAVGLSVMILSLAVVRGFKNEIKQKIIGIGGHIQVVNLDNNSSFESKPISRSRAAYFDIKKSGEVRHIQVFATKHAILKTDEELQGVVVKGVSEDFDWSFFQNHLVSGKILDRSEKGALPPILISKLNAGKLNLQVGDTLMAVYLGKTFNKKDSTYSEEPKGKKVIVGGIYETGLYELDMQLVMAPLELVQEMYNWESDQVTGYELLIDDFSQLENKVNAVFDIIPRDLYAFTIEELYARIFYWLPTIDINSVIIIVLMIMVGMMAMISTLLILILERTSFIGIMKALGMCNWGLRRIFIYHAAYIVLRGLIIGNILGIGLALIQMVWAPVKLNQESYYLPVVPVELNIWHIIFLNLGTLVACVLALLLPSYLITRISPVRAIRID